MLGPTLALSLALAAGIPQGLEAEAPPAVEQLPAPSPAAAPRRRPCPGDPTSGWTW